jgi:hypothetical protein
MQPEGRRPSSAASGKPLFGSALTRLVVGEDVIVMQVTDPQY